MPVKLWRKPLDTNTIKLPRGKVHIIDDRCKECGFCIEFCPKKVLDKSPKFNRKGYHPPMVKDEDKCVSCGLCEIICPDFAIFNTQEAPEAQDANEAQEAHNGGETRKGKDETEKKKGGGN